MEEKEVRGSELRAQCTAARARVVPPLYGGVLLTGHTLQTNPNSHPHPYHHPHPNPHLPHPHLKSDYVVTLTLTLNRNPTASPNPLLLALASTGVASCSYFSEIAGRSRERARSAHLALYGPD